MRTLFYVAFILNCIGSAISSSYLVPNLSVAHWLVDAALVTPSIVMFSIGEVTNA